MPNSFQDLTSFLANICTIITLFFAIWLWNKWKAQENYSFFRDNIFELELKSAYSYITLIQLITCYFNYCYVRINNDAVEMDLKLKEYDDFYNKWLEGYFIFGANHLIVSNLLHNDDFKIDHEDINSLNIDYISKINEFKERMDKADSHDSLRDLFVTEQKNFKNIFVNSILTTSNARKNL